jgi:hypothetical protein
MVSMAIAGATAATHLVRELLRERHQKHRTRN